MGAEELEKSLEELDKLAEDFKKSNAEKEDPEEEEKDQKDQKDDDTSEGEGVEKAAKPDEIAEDEEDKDKKEGKNEETKDENNNEEGNTKKLMDKNAKKAEKVDESGEEAPEDAEDEKDDTDEEDEEDQVSKSMNDLFDPLYKSVQAGSNAENILDVFHKSMYNQEKSTRNVEESITMLTRGLTKALDEVIKSNKRISSHVRRLEKANKSQSAVIEEQREFIEKSLNTQEELAKSQPMPRKSTVSVMEKSFDHSAGIADAGSRELSKGEVLEKLTSLATSGDSSVTVNDVMSYESTGELRPEIQKLIIN